MALVFNCPHCGGQNFVSPERLNHREKPVVCWICNMTISWTFLESLAEGGREMEEGEKELSVEGGEE